jgi:ABC-type lipoprotein release transport system permease subunit
MIGSSRWRTVFVWIMAAFSAFGVLLGVGTLAVVWFAMETFRRAARAGQADLAALPHEQNTLPLLLALIVSVAAISMVAGFVLLLKRAQQSG